MFDAAFEARCLHTMIAYIFSREGSSVNRKVFASWTSMPSSWSADKLDNMVDIRPPKSSKKSENVAAKSRPEET